MIKINLLPKDLKRRKKGQLIDKVLLYIILALILEIVVLYYVNVQQKDHIAQLEKDITFYDNQIRLQSKKIEMVEKANALKKNITQRMSVIQSLETQRPLWVKTLEEFCSVIPDNLWYTSLEYKGKESIITIGANSYSLNDIAKYINNLKESAFFEGVNLHEVTRDNKGKGKSYNFKVTMKLIKDQTKAEAGEFKLAKKKDTKKKDSNLKDIDLTAKGREALGVDKESARKAMEGLKN